MLESEVIAARKAAARKWMEKYKATIEATTVGVERRALGVIVMDPKISDWLAEHDPKALKQCQEALTGVGSSFLL